MQTSDSGLRCSRGHRDDGCRAPQVEPESPRSRLGKDTVSHAPGGHGDVANAVAGAVVRTLGSPVMTSGYAIFQIMKERYEASRPLKSQTRSPGQAESNQHMRGAVTMTGTTPLLPETPDSPQCAADPEGRSSHTCSS